VTATTSTVSRRLPWTAALSDGVVIARRNLRRIARTPQLLVFSTIQPVMFVLLFRYVFGGSIRVPGVRYVDYLMPGIFVQTVLFGGASTAVGLSEDMSKGIVDRFRSLPMARSAVLVGRTVADLARNVFVVALMVVVGIAVGFRFHDGFAPGLGAVGLSLLFGFSFSWFFAYMGLTVTDPEAAQVAGFLPIFPLVFASGAFTPVKQMPGWLQAFANNQPVTHVVASVRALTQGGPVAHHLLLALLWMAGITAVFVPLSVRRYRRG
jgi:ABC-2 type transport system permease protein/oleandomycin transport system permease protein